uniref:Uncharacterized protein n=1 Tax=Anguilla anguilla TaxID=7936 RepID=A0A0E9S7Z5_ANGAN
MPPPLFAWNNSKKLVNKVGSLISANMVRFTLQFVYQK